MYKIRNHKNSIWNNQYFFNFKDLPFFSFFCTLIESLIYLNIIVIFNVQEYLYELGFLSDSFKYDSFSEFNL